LAERMEGAIQAGCMAPSLAAVVRLRAPLY
jgi:hypothetical protein